MTQAICEDPFTTVEAFGSLDEIEDSNQPTQIEYG